MATELTEESTQEDIQAAVDEIVAEVDAEGADDEKSDAQITSEHADNQETPVDTDEEETAAEEEDLSDSETTDEADDADWRADALVEASAYGFSEDDIAEFSSREELDRALNLFDKRIEQERQPKSKEPDLKDEPEESAGTNEGQYEIRLDQDIYDEEIVDEFTRMRDHYESRLAAIERRFQEADAEVAEERFDRTVDDLGFANLFGKTGEETDAEMSRRKQLYEEVGAYQDVLSSLGRKSVDFRSLVERVARTTFPDEYDKKLLKNHTRRISRQSSKRQGGGVTRPTDPPEDPRDHFDQMFKELAGA